jgi:hypothetical protein
VKLALAGKALKSHAVSDVHRGYILSAEAGPLYVKGLPLMGEGGEPAVTDPLPVYLTALVET